MSPLDLENWDFLAIHRAFCCCVFSLSGFYTAARCDIVQWGRKTVTTGVTHSAIDTPEGRDHSRHNQFEKLD